MGNWALNPLGAKTKAPPADGVPFGFAWENDKSQHVVYRGTDGQIHELYFKRGFMNQEWQYGGALNDKIHAPGAAGSPVGFAWEHDNTQHIVYRGADNHIHEIFYKRDLTHSGWSYGGAISQSVGAPEAAGDPSAFAFEGDKTQHIVYRGADGHVHELFYKLDLTHHGWQHGGALDEAVHAPAPAGDPAGFTWEKDGTMHVVYRGTDGQVHELFWKQDLTHHGWAYGGALSQKVGAPAAATDPSAFAWEADKTQHVLYASADGAVNEIYYKLDLIGGGWKYGGPLSSTVHAPGAAGKPCGYVWERDKTQHIVYRAADGNIHEIFYKQDLTHHGWAYGGPLSANVHGPAAASDPIGFAWEGDDTQHVVYRDTSNQIEEIWQR